MAATNASDATMRAWQYSKIHNGLENSITLNEASARPPWSPSGKDSKDKVLVRVQYAALNPVDAKLAEAGLPVRAVISLPAVPGFDFAGVVAGLPDGFNDAEGKEKYEVGDRVLGRLALQRFGALGEYVTVPRGALAHVPEGVGLDEASCVGTAATTALQCIAPHVVEGAGDRVFINGGSGGTGTFGVQIAKALGCHVVASCSGANADLCRRLGADEVIDYKTQDVCARLRELAADGKFKLVVDNVGASPRDLYKASDDFLVPTGVFVQVGADMSLGGMGNTAARALLPGFLGGGHRKWMFIVTKDVPEDFARIVGWMADGKVKTVIDEVFEYKDVPKAFAKLKTNRVKGKVIVKVAD